RARPSRRAAAERAGAAGEAELALGRHENVVAELEARRDRAEPAPPRAGAGDPAAGPVAAARGAGARNERSATADPGRGAAARGGGSLLAATRGAGPPAHPDRPRRRGQDADRDRDRDRAGGRV